jgi:hypothetical protein
MLTSRRFDLQLFAHKSSSGSSRNGRDSNPKSLGVKAFGGNLSGRAASSCGSAARDSAPEMGSAWGAITRSSPCATVL